MKYIIGNWKMNMTTKQIVEFSDNLRKIKVPKASKANITFGLGVPSIYTLGMAKLQSHCLIGAQNVSEYDNGAYTGEISAEMLGDVGVDFCIVGHSERRTLFNETNKIINQKIKKLQAYDVMPILCVGESLAEFEKGKTKEVLTKQLTECLEGIDSNQDIFVAYEPIWAIGTGKSADARTIKEACLFIKKQVAQILGKDVVVLYGGSVNPGNASTILHCDGVDGVLIGGASTDAVKYMQIASTVF